MNKYCFFIACLLITFSTIAQNGSFDTLLDSIQRLRKLSTDKNLEINARLLYAKQASELSYKTKVDSTILFSNAKLAYLHILDNNLKYSKRLLDKNLKLASKLNKPSFIMDTSSLLGYYYHSLQIQNDSAYYYYYKALELSRKLTQVEIEIDLLHNIARLQIANQNYIGSDANITRAINLLKSQPENNKSIDNVVFSYSTIALNAKHLKLYDKAIEYYNKALTTNNKLSKGYETHLQENHLFNNINLAEAYKEKGEFKKALSIHEDLLADKDLLKKDPISFATVVNNKAYTLFLSKDKKTECIKPLFNQAYKISDSINALYEITGIGNDMAEFYHTINKKDSAYILSKRSYKIGKNIKNYHEVSRALLTLSKIEKGEAGKQYLYEHIKLNDSLLDVERASRNKFARIHYETDNYIDETERLATQNILIVVIGLIFFLILALIFIIRVQTVKNKILRFESEQQKANEEIYTLMLRQQAKVEEGRLLERHRISEELHDGILNRLLGSRLGMEFLSLNEEVESREKYGFYINEIQSVEKEIRDLSHELKNTQLDADKDFITILKDYIAHQSNPHTFQYNINQNGTIFWEDINDYIKVGLYRIIQEALQNIIKHAKANTVSINFSLNSNKLHLEIIDDGIGFNTNQKNDGIGLLNIASRVSKLKGKFKIKSKIRNGTTLAIKIPLF